MSSALGKSEGSEVLASPNPNLPSKAQPHRYICNHCQADPELHGGGAGVSPADPGLLYRALTSAAAWLSSASSRSQGLPYQLEPKAQISTGFWCSYCTRPITSISYYRDGQPDSFKWSRRADDNAAAALQRKINISPSTVAVFAASLPCNSSVSSTTAAVGWQTWTTRRRRRRSTPTSDEHQRLMKRQAEFARKFNYIAGTSTGAFISFALAVDYPLHRLAAVYQEREYFRKHFFSLWSIARPRYKPHPIHEKIDEVIKHAIDQYNAAVDDLHKAMPDKWVQVSLWHLPKEVASHEELKIVRELPDPAMREAEREALYVERFTIGHLNVLLNKDLIIKGCVAPGSSAAGPLPRFRSLLVSTFNLTENKVTVYNSGLRWHSRMPLVHILKGTMAAPTYFPIYRGRRPGFPGPTDYIDGGIFANDPELAAYLTSHRSANQNFIHVFPRDGAKIKFDKPEHVVQSDTRNLSTDTLVQRNILALGTGLAAVQTSKDTNNSSALCWLALSPGLLVDTILEANRSFVERMTTEIAAERHLYVNRMRFNFESKDSLPLDDLNFCIRANPAIQRFFPGPAAGAKAVSPAPVSDDRIDSLLSFYDTFIA
jgi:predicted acylesterase/phospholipase RssA